MTQQAFALLGSAGFSTSGIIGRVTFSGGILVEPNGQVTSVGSISGVVGFGFATPVEFGTQTVILSPGNGLSSFTGFGGQVTANFITQTGVNFSGIPLLGASVNRVVAGLVSAISVTGSFGYTFQFSVIAPPLQTGTPVPFLAETLAAQNLLNQASSQEFFQNSVQTAADFIDATNQAVAANLNQIGDGNGIGGGVLSTAHQFVDTSTSPGQIGDGISGVSSFSTAQQFIDGNGGIGFVNGDGEKDDCRSNSGNCDCCRCSLVTFQISNGLRCSQRFVASTIPGWVEFEICIP